MPASTSTPAADAAAVTSAASDDPAAGAAAPPGRTRAEPAPLAGMGLAITSIALALGTFMQVLDSSIANVSIPTIAGDLGVSADQGTWVITSFAVANGISVPLTGWLMGRFGVVKTFVGSVLLFTVASFLCGVSWNLPSLIGFRILQGAVSGPMIPGSQALLISIFPPNRRGGALAIWSMTTLVAPVIGPVLGGYISDNYSWPWIFLINVPVGVLCAFLCWTNLRSRETPAHKMKVDTVGFGLLVVWVGALQVMLDTGKDADWFSSPAIVVLACVSAVSFAAWIIWELTEANPIVDLSLFKSRNFAIGASVTCLGYGVFFGNNVLLPLWLQTRLGYVATWAGLVAAPSGVVAVLLTPIAARIMTRVDARWTASLALVAFATSFWMRSLYPPDASFGVLVMPMLVQGVAMSVFFVSLITLTLNGVPPEQLPKATGLSNFTRITAGSFAASITTTLWDRGAAVGRTRITETTGPWNPDWQAAMNGLHRAGLDSAHALGVLSQQIESQAYLVSTLDYFRASAWIILIALPGVWLTSRAVGGGGGAAGD
ncbi:MAG TPA: DHA2 family efflux MFS transporter permease subunit [Caulobacteraceae bacterium]|jgi:DHA2 family multidrug resistance protein|nr:DHA2 family efflux MFS transporter permease subunit [Caulobacteraceae bacterium]